MMFWRIIDLKNIPLYITHTNIPVILLVNTTSRDIKYYAYIPNIWREGKKVLYKMDISLILRDIVDILPISPTPTLIMWLPWRLLVLFSPTVTKTLLIYGPKLLIQMVSNWEFRVQIGHWQCPWNIAVPMLMMQHQCIGHIRCQSQF